MIKVLMINYEYPPLGGGTAIACAYLLREFKKLPVKADLLTYRKKTNLQHQSYWDLFKFFITATFWALRYKNNYDLIHAFSGLPGAVTAWLTGKPYIVSLRGADEPGYEPRHRLFWKVFQPLVGFIYRRARALDANSLFLKNLVLKSWPDLNIKIIRNGVDTAKFYPAKKPVKNNIILCTSRLGQRKGVEYLIQAMVNLPRAQLWLAGSGVEEKKLKALTKKLALNSRVKFLGAVPHNHLPALYRRAKVFALPSLSESNSNSLLEALASGLPVVTTNIGGNPELVNKNNGLLVPPKNPEALATAINTALNKSWPAIKLPANFSWNKSVQKYFSLYSRISALSNGLPSSTNR